MELPQQKVRGPRLVARILEAALAEIARVGYEKLSVEEVAQRAAVNKTTIYRRWPDGDALALAALEHGSTDGTMPDHGNLRDDLLDYARQVRAVCRTPAMLSLARLQLSGGLTGKVGEIVRARVEASACNSRGIFERAAARGELAAGADLDVLHDLALGSVQQVLVVQNRELSDAEIEKMLDVVLAGMWHVDWSTPGKRPKPGVVQKAAVLA